MTFRPWKAPVPTALSAGALLFFLSVPCGAAGQWVSSPGEGWIDATFIYHGTSREFDSLGEEREMFAQGRAVTRSIFLTGNIGIWRGIDLWIQAPFHRLRFDDAGGERVSSGPGDPTAFLRLGSGLWDGVPDWPVALRGGVKLEGGSFDVDPEIIPLGEGQVDWELLVEVGRSFHPRSVWISGWIGYRWRRENRRLLRNPGNEVFWLWSVGGELMGPLGWKVTLEGLSGGAWILEGLRIRTARRSLHQVFLDGSYRLGRGSVRAGVRVPFRGRNLPTGTAFTAGYFFRWGGG